MGRWGVGVGGVCSVVHAGDVLGSMREAGGPHFCLKFSSRD